MYSPVNTKRQRRGGGATTGKRPTTPGRRPVVPDAVKADNEKAAKRTGHSALARRASVTAARKTERASPGKKDRGSSRQRLGNNELERVGSAKSRREQKQRERAKRQEPASPTPRQGDVGAPGTDLDSAAYNMQHYPIDELEMSKHAKGMTKAKTRRILEAGKHLVQPL